MQVNDITLFAYETNFPWILIYTNIKLHITPFKKGLK